MTFDILTYLDRPDEGNHSVIGASSAERWMTCPGSIRLAEGVPKRPASKYAVEGTRAHRLAELVLTGKVEPWECVGLVPREMIDGVSMYADHVHSLAQGLSTVLVEKEFHLSEFDERAFGTADAVAISLRKLHVIDFKYGAGVAVDVCEDNDASGFGGDSETASNPQLLFYALGAYLEAQNDFPIKEIHIWVVQPRAEHARGPIRHAEISVEALLAWGDKLKKAMAETRAPNAALAKGDHCRWCPALSVCPLQGTLRVGDATLDFTDVTKKVELPAAQTLTGKQIGLVLEQQQVVETWFKAVREHAFAQLQMGRDVPGFKLVAGRRSRAWTDATKAEKFLKAKLGASAYVTSLLTVPQAEKLVDVPEHLIAVSEPPPTIAKESDNRKPYKREIKDFNDE